MFVPDPADFVDLIAARKLQLTRALRRFTEVFNFHLDLEECIAHYREDPTDHVSRDGRSIEDRLIAWIAFLQDELHTLFVDSTQCRLFDPEPATDQTSMRVDTMSKQNTSPDTTVISVIFSPATIEKLKSKRDCGTSYFDACNGDFQRIADTIVDFGVSRWSALSKHSVGKGRGPLIPGERKTRGGTPGPRKAREPGAVVTRDSVDDIIADVTAAKQTAETPADAPKAPKPKTAEPKAEKPATAAETKPKAKAKTPEPSPEPKKKGKAAKTMEWVICFNPNKQTVSLPRDAAKSEEEAKAIAVKDFGVKAKSILSAGLVEV